MGRGNGSFYSGGQGTLARRARARAEPPPAEPVEAILAANESHYVTVLAQEQTQTCVKALARIVKAKGSSDAAKISAAKVLLEWGWRPALTASSAASRRPIGNDGGQGLTIKIVSAVNHTTQQVLRVGEENPHAEPSVASLVLAEGKVVLDA